jgi:hypothetical protein
MKNHKKRTKGKEKIRGKRIKFLKKLKIIHEKRHLIPSISVKMIFLNERFLKKKSNLLMIKLMKSIEGMMMNLGGIEFSDIEIDKIYQGNNKP